MGRSNSSKKLQKILRNVNVSIVFFSSWLPFRSLGSMAAKFFRCHRHIVTCSAGLGGAKGVSLCPRLVGLSDWKKFECRGDVGLVLFSIGFRKIRFGLGTSKNEDEKNQIDSWTSKFSRKFYISHPSFKALQMLLVLLLI